MGRLQHFELTWRLLRRLTGLHRRPRIPAALSPTPPGRPGEPPVIPRVPDKLEQPLGAVEHLAAERDVTPADAVFDAVMDDSAAFARHVVGQLDAPAGCRCSSVQVVAH